MDIIIKTLLLKELGLLPEIVNIIGKILYNDLIKNAYDIINIDDIAYALDNRNDWYYGETSDRTIIYGFNKLIFNKVNNNPYLYFCIEGPCRFTDFCEVIDYGINDDYIIAPWK